MFLQISFQEFKNKLLATGLVDRIVVSNKSVAKVYVRSTPQIHNRTHDNEIRGSADAHPKHAPSQYKYYFNIGNLGSFEEKLEEAQEALGIDPHDYAPVTYISDVVWYQELLKFAPTALFFGLLYFMGRRIQGGVNVGGPGKGSQGIFNIGKAQVTKMDKNSKNKASMSSLGLVFLVFPFLINKTMSRKLIFYFFYFTFVVMISNYLSVVCVPLCTELNELFARPYSSCIFIIVCLS